MGQRDRSAGTEKLDTVARQRELGLVCRARQMRCRRLTTRTAPAVRPSWSARRTAVGQQRSRCRERRRSIPERHQGDGDLVCRGRRMRGGRAVQRRRGDRQAWVLSETNGGWGTAIKVPGTAALNTGGDAGVSRSRVPRPANAPPAATTPTAPTTRQAYVVSETNGSWGDAIEVPGTATLNSGG